MKLIAMVLTKSEYHGEKKSEEEIIQGYKDFLAERIDLNPASYSISVVIEERDTDEN